MVSLPEGRYVTGEFHNHSCISPDVSEPYMCLDNILKVVFGEEGGLGPERGKEFDFLMTADHMRLSPRSVDASPSVSATWEKIAEQVALFNALKAEGKWGGKIYYPGFEWDMPGLDHASIALIDDGVNVPLEAIHEFEWRYSWHTPDDVFHSDEFLQFGPRLQDNPMDLDITLDALSWIKQHYPNSLFCLNHPSGCHGTERELKIEHIRRLHDLAPTIACCLEGIPGNQFSGERGEYAEVYGGADRMVATLGGIWDALLGEGRRIFMVANSDFHFKISSNRLYSSGYWPGEYSRNYIYTTGVSFGDVLNGFRSGRAFAVMGDLITDLEFEVYGESTCVSMGGEASVEKGELVQIVIRFKEGESSEDVRALDHIDLIGGLILGKAKDYTSSCNPTTKVIQRFLRSEWLQAEDGFLEVHTQLSVADAMYLRLRGTNLAPGTLGEVDDEGEPLKDLPLLKECYATMEDYFLAIHNRNMSDLWFYSNPLFLRVK